MRRQEGCVRTSEDVKECSDVVVANECMKRLMTLHGHCVPTRSAGGSTRLARRFVHDRQQWGSAVTSSTGAAIARDWDYLRIYAGGG